MKDIPEFLLFMAVFFLILVLGVGPDKFLSFVGNWRYSTNKSDWPDPDMAQQYASYLNTSGGWNADGSGPLPAGS
jgi:hypothetical protein